jgi:hypothetical protein
MPAIIRTLGIAILLATILPADTLEVIDVTSRDRHVETDYMYEHNGSMRVQTTGNFRFLKILIWNEPCKCAYELDPKRREYKKYTNRDLTSYVAHLIARPHVVKSGKTVDIYYEATDTGQRRQFLGRTARYLQVTERTVARPGACTYPYYSAKDNSGWYIPRKNWKPITTWDLAEKCREHAYTAVLSYTCEDTVVKHGAPLSSELLVLQETQNSIVKVSALSDAPLDDSLFEPPPNYKKVDYWTGQEPATWRQILARKWDELEDAISTWF